MKTTNEDTTQYDIFLAKSNSSIRQIFLEIKKSINSIDISIYEQINKSMLTFKKSRKSKQRGIVWLQPGVNNLIIYFAKGNYSSSSFKIFPEGFGGYPYIKVTHENFNMNEIKRLSIEALEKINSIL